MANKDLNATVALNAEALAELLQQVKQIQQGKGAAAAAPEGPAEERVEEQVEEELPVVLPPPAARRPPLPAARSWFRR